MPQPVVAPSIAELSSTPSSTLDPDTDLIAQHLQGQHRPQFVPVCAPEPRRPPGRPPGVPNMYTQLKRDILDAWNRADGTGLLSKHLQSTIKKRVIDGVEVEAHDPRAFGALMAHIVTLLPREDTLLIGRAETIYCGPDADLRCPPAAEPVSGLARSTRPQPVDTPDEGG